MKELLYSLLLLCFIISIKCLQFSVPVYECERINSIQSLKYRGTSITLSASDSWDSWDIKLCPGDAFGDLNGTNAVIQNCRLAIYHKDQRIWSIGGDSQPELSNFVDSSSNSDSDTEPCNDCVCTCVLSLKLNGNLVFSKKELSKYVWIEKTVYWLVTKAWDAWESETDTSPIKAELRFQNQQIQLVQTFEDGSQRLFYADQNNPKFKEDIEEPVKVADKFLISNYTKSDEQIGKTILQRNEYIGDMNGTHFIFHHNGTLLLRNQNNTIWSFAPPFRHACFLKISSNSISICRRSKDKWQMNKCEDIMNDWTLDVAQSKITFDDHQLILIQTLKNGSEIVFSSGTGQNHSLKPRRKLNQIAEKTLNLSKDFQMDRMDYIGDLNGLHLILEQNCSLILRNADQKLWEFHPKTPADFLTDCSLGLFQHRAIHFKQERRSWEKDEDDSSEYIYNREDLLLLDENYKLISIQLDLENNQLIITGKHTDGTLVVYQAGRDTPGGTFEGIDSCPVIINHRARRSFQRWAHNL